MRGNESARVGGYSCTQHRQGAAGGDSWARTTSTSRTTGARRCATASTSTAVVSIAHGAKVHPSAVVEAGSYVEPGVQIAAGAHVGRGVWVESDAVIGPDAEIAPHAHIGPRAAIGAGAKIGVRTHVGTRRPRRRRLAHRRRRDDRRRRARRDRPAGTSPGRLIPAIRGASRARHRLAYVFRRVLIGDPRARPSRARRSGGSPRRDDGSRRGGPTRPRGTAPTMPAIPADAFEMTVESVHDGDTPARACRGAERRRRGSGARRACACSASTPPRSRRRPDCWGAEATAKLTALAAGRVDDLGDARRRGARPVRPDAALRLDARRPLRQRRARRAGRRARRGLLTQSQPRGPAAVARDDGCRVGVRPVGRVR